MQLQWCCGDPELALAGARCTLSNVSPQPAVSRYSTRRALGNKYAALAGRAYLHACARTTADGLERACAADAELLTFKLVFKLNWLAPLI
jgi:hypothetical protein